MMRNGRGREIGKEGGNGMDKLPHGDGVGFIVRGPGELIGVLVGAVMDMRTCVGLRPIAHDAKWRPRQV